ncbi:2-C-methyl-D-erythritol 4-phosphate cytidylyltransferase [Pullulanibacillus camelliae]|uniref:2-C-methyl-D-erythritol 4-phosphate cytidylyltransferase n=1 Tax=Pullulanibacillus camelliae TaxID=1707096 RepID=A0A8J3E018_9BACL|nr:2-C-methyl-D-erythritol 4-phosphate cytidylyltransferase [Pullulanibacillus camelliae]GGE56787.1 2-C-methyl-D-erythritol 4-phosphate cytidylyltransferase [Pullulanibacillus camelliae]
MAEYSVVIPAAGSGTRMGAEGNKLFLQLNGEPLITHTLKLFQEDPWCSSVVLAAKPEEFEQFYTIIEEKKLNKVQTLIAGGADRQESVHNGLKVIKEETVILIHDGARPLVTEALIHHVVEQAEQAGAALLAVPLKDTIKRAYNNKVVETVDREQLWAAQTPQGFRLSLIREAHDKADRLNYKATDDASLVEWLGQPVRIVKSDYRNIKVTTPEDLIIAEHFMIGRES